MTLIALIVASWMVLSVISACGFALIAGAIKHSEPAVDSVSTPMAPSSSRSAPVTLPTQRLAAAPVLVEHRG